MQLKLFSSELPSQTFVELPLVCKLHCVDPMSQVIRLGIHGNDLLWGTCRDDVLQEFLCDLLWRTHVVQALSLRLGDLKTNELQRLNDVPQEDIIAFVGGLLWASGKFELIAHVGV